MHTKINWTKEFLSGLYAAFIVICFTQAAVLLIFAGRLADYIPLGLAGGLIGVTIVNLFYGLTSRIPWSLATTSPSLAAILILMTDEIYHSTTLEQFVPTAIAAIILMSLSIGLTMYIAGISRLVRFLRFMPYPVIGGFMAVTGWMMLIGSSQIMHQDLPFVPTNTLQLLLYNWLGIVWGFLIFAGSRFFRNKYILLIMILGGIILIHLYLYFTNISPPEAIIKGYLLSDMRISLMLDRFNLDVINNINWNAIREQLNYFVVVSLSGILIQTFRLNNLESTSVSRKLLNNEITSCGQAVLVSSVFGGILATPSVPVNYLLQRVGVRTVLPTIITIIAVLALMYFSPNLLSYTPKAILVGLVIYCALEIFYEWLYQAIWRLPIEDYLVVLSILVIAIFFGFMISIAYGVIVASGIFIVKYSRINNIKYQLTGQELRSKHKYSIPADQYLREMGKKTLIMKLQGYLFFGSSRTLLENMHHLLKKNPPGTFVNLIFDFQLVTGIDTSAVLNFFTLGRISKKYNVNFLICDCNEQILEQFISMTHPQSLKENVKFMPTLDYAQEWCEKNFLEAGFKDEGKQDLHSLFKDPKNQATFLKYWTKSKLPPGSYLFHQDDKSNSLFFIESGKVTAYIKGPEEDTNIRLFTTESSVLLGEMAFFSGAPRTATAITDTACVIYELSRKKLEHIQKEHPELVREFYESVIKLLSQRLSDLNREIEFYQL